MILDMLGTYAIEHGFRDYPEYKELRESLFEEERKNNS